MRNILALVGAATLTFLIVGWYLGWYQISGIPGPGGKQTVSIQVHTDKAIEDGKRIGGKIIDGVDSLRDQAKEKPAPLTTPPGPASRFFGPAPEPKTAPGGGWRPIQRSDDEGASNFNRPRN